LAVSYSDGLLEFHHPDRIGTQLVTFGGTIGTVRQSTYPFGTLEQGPYSNQIFTSYDRSTSTGLDYAVNRTYSSGQSRFTQVDPIGMAAVSIGNPQSNNLYAYVQNMPTDFVDPSGLCGAGTVSITVNGMQQCIGVGSYSVTVTGGNNTVPVAGVTGWMGTDTTPMIIEDLADGYLPGDVGGGGGGQDGCTGLAVSGRAVGNAVVITFPDGSEETRLGGTRTWRNNNPGNLRSAQTQIGRAGGFAVFGTIIDGQAAKYALLQSSRYNSLTIGGAIARWAPPSENNTARYQAFVANQTGLNLQTPMSSLSPSQLVSMANAMGTYEGFRAGTTSCSR
jgi:RHS repeat-associated protein